jgi:hypothetical protein
VALVHWPSRSQLAIPIRCEICDATKTLSDIAAGALRWDGSQAFACNSHFYDADRLVAGWADFAHAQSRSSGTPPAGHATPDDIYIEQRIANTSGEVSADLVRHLYARFSVGLVAIVTDNPNAFRPVLLKRWRKIVYQVQRARSSTLDAARILELTKNLSIMQHLPFTVQPALGAADDADLGVHFLTLDQALEAPQFYTTMYIVSNADRLTISRLGGAVRSDGLLVVYATTGGAWDAW